MEDLDLGLYSGKAPLSGVRTPLSTWKPRAQRTCYLFQLLYSVYSNRNTARSGLWGRWWETKFHFEMEYPFMVQHDVHSEIFWLFCLQHLYRVFIRVTVALLLAWNRLIILHWPFLLKGCFSHSSLVVVFFLLHYSE